MSRLTPQADPLEFFCSWYAEAQQANIAMPDAMTLATATAEGVPSARMVLYKGLSEGGFRFVTNYGSRKAAELDANPHAALVFWWRKLGRQVRVEGTVEKVTPEESDAYFASRSRGRSIGAWASLQSSIISDPEVIRERTKEFEARFPGDVPRPESWGGYRVLPTAIEFWQEGDDRLHTRLRYRREGVEWITEYLAP